VTNCKLDTAWIEAHLRGAAVFAQNRAPVAMSADRRDELLGHTALGRAVLSGEPRGYGYGPAATTPEPPRPVPGPGTALAEERKRESERTLSPARRKELLSMTPAGRRILAGEAQPGPSK
jgi:hypothetical protein